MLAECKVTGVGDKAVAQAFFALPVMCDCQHAPQPQPSSVHTTRPDGNMVATTATHPHPRTCNRLDPFFGVMPFTLLDHFEPFHTILTILLSLDSSGGFTRFPPFAGHLWGLPPIPYNPAIPLPRGVTQGISGRIPKVFRGCVGHVPVPQHHQRPLLKSES